MDDWEAAASSWVPTSPTTLSDTTGLEGEQEPIPEDIPAVVSEPFNVKHVGQKETLKSLGVATTEDGKPVASPEDAPANDAPKSAENVNSSPPLETVVAATSTSAAANSDIKGTASGASDLKPNTTASTTSAPLATPPASSSSEPKGAAHTRGVTTPTLKLRPDWWYHIADIAVLGTVPVKREAFGGGDAPAATTEYQLKVTSRGDTWTVCHSHSAFKELLDELNTQDKTIRDMGISIVKRRASVFSLRRYTGRSEEAHREAEEKALSSITNFMTALKDNPRQNCAWGFVQLFLQPYTRADAITHLADGGAQGWMWKKGKNNTAWKSRFVAVCGRTLYYYISRLTQRQGIVPLIEINDVTTTSADPGPDRPSRLVVQLHCKDRVWNLCAKSPQTTLKWVEIFKSQIAKSKKIVERINSKKALTKA